MQDEAACRNCRFSLLVAKADGLCRRAPPVALVCEDGVTTEWPRVQPDDWCGDHEERGAHILTDLRVVSAPFVRLAAEYLRENPEADDDDLWLHDLIDEEGHPVSLTVGECRALVEAAG